MHRLQRFMGYCLLLLLLSGALLPPAPAGSGVAGIMPVNDDRHNIRPGNSSNCGPGYYPVTKVVNGETVTDCLLCPAGSYCPDGAARIHCPTGAFSDVVGSTARPEHSTLPWALRPARTVRRVHFPSVSCTDCPNGFTSDAGATACYPRGKKPKND